MDTLWFNFCLIEQSKYLTLIGNPAFLYSNNRLYQISTNQLYIILSFLSIYLDQMTRLHNISISNYLLLWSLCASRLSKRSATASLPLCAFVPEKSVAWNAAAEVVPACAKIRLLSRLCLACAAREVKLLRGVVTKACVPWYEFVDTEPIFYMSFMK